MACPDARLTFNAELRMLLYSCVVTDSVDSFDAESIKILMIQQNLMKGIWEVA